MQFVEATINDVKFVKRYWQALIRACAGGAFDRAGVRRGHERVPRSHTNLHGRPQERASREVAGSRVARGASGPRKGSGRTLILSCSLTGSI